MLMIAVTLALALAGQAPSGDVLFKNDVKQYVADGDKTKDVDVTLTIGAESLTITRKAKDVTVIPFSAITAATYDRRQRQRKIMGLPAGPGYSPKLQHFLTVKFKTDAAGDFVELELGKDIANRVVATIEAKTGKPVEKMIGG